MATVINTPVARETSDSAAAGWAVAVIVLIAAGLIALFVWPGYVRQSTVPAPAAPAANINVTLPTTGGDSGASGSSGSGAQTSPASGATQSGM